MKIDEDVPKSGSAWVGTLFERTQMKLFIGKLNPTEVELEVENRLPI